MRAATCLLLDLDGTLTDSRPGIVASLHAALRSLGHAPDVSVDLGHVLGPPLEDAMAAVLAPYGDTRVAEAVAAYRRHYAAGAMFHATLYPGIADFLTTARRAGCRLYLATSKQAGAAVRILEHFGLAGRFNGIYGALPDGSLGHKPALIAHILAHAAIAPEDAVMIGDRCFDIRGAQANRVRSIGVLWGYGSRAELTEAGADALVASPAELMTALHLGTDQCSPVAPRHHSRPDHLRPEG